MLVWNMQGSTPVELRRKGLGRPQKAPQLQAVSCTRPRAHLSFSSNLDRVTLSTSTGRDASVTPSIASDHSPQGLSGQREGVGKGGRLA